MRNAILVGLGVLFTGMFIYMNDYIHETSTAGMETPAPAVDVNALAQSLRSVEMVIVPVTNESDEAFSRAVEENEDASIFELGVTLEDLTYEINAGVPAVIALTHEDYLQPGFAFRTDTPLGLLEHVRSHPTIDHLVLNPRHESARHDMESVVLGPDEIEKLIELLK